MEEHEEKEEITESRIVVLKHMFTLEELKDDPSLLLDLKEDVREEAETVGDVTNVVLYDVRDLNHRRFRKGSDIFLGGTGRDHDCKIP